MRKFLVYEDKILSLLIVHSVELKQNDMGSYDLHIIYVTCQLDNPQPKTFSYCWRLKDITTESRKELFKERLLKFMDDDPLHSRQSIFKVEEEAQEAAHEAWKATMREDSDE